MIINSEDLFVVSGGARGITAQCIIQMARRYHCKFILLGRSELASSEPEWAQGWSDDTQLKQRYSQELRAKGEKPAPARIQQAVQMILARREILDTLQAIQQAGGQAEYLCVDIADREAVQRQLGTMTLITGLIHGAGRLADKLIEKKTVDDFEAVYSTKVDGLQNLLDCIQPSTLKTVILFSSAAGFYGNVGQADYALSNEILNKVAHQLRHKYPDMRVLSINWGPWDAGMVSEALKQHFLNQGVQLIPIEQGPRMLIEELDHYEETQIVIGASMTRTPSTPGVAPLRTHSIWRALTLEANQFAPHHTIGGRPVLSLCHALTWISNTCEQLYPGYRFFSAENFKVLNGIVFDENLSDAYLLILKEVTKDALDGIVFDALVSSTTRLEKKRYHYSTRIHLLAQLPSIPTYQALDLNADHPVSGATLYQDGTLFHGIYFQGIETVLNSSPDKVTVSCIAPDVPVDQQGQFVTQTLDPFAADIQFQVMLIWARKFYQAASLPVGAASGQLYRPFPHNQRFYVSMDVRAHSETRLLADITAHDEQGRIYGCTTGAEVTLSQRLNALFLNSVVEVKR